MTTTDKLLKLNADYQSRALQISHTEYLKRYWRLVNQIKRESRPKTISMLIKASGASVHKEKGYGSGYYIYKGVNFTVKFNSEVCETLWWEINFWEDTNNSVDQRLYDKFNDWNQWHTKTEILQSLYAFDQDLTDNK